MAGKWIRAAKKADKSPFRRELSLHVLSDEGRVEERSDRRVERRDYAEGSSAALLANQKEYGFEATL